MLNPEGIRIRAALCDQVRILHVRVELAFGGHELGAEARARDVPGPAAIARAPHAAARHADEHVARVATREIIVEHIAQRGAGNLACRALHVPLDAFGKSHGRH